MTDLHVETVFCLLMTFSKKKFEFNMYFMFYSNIGILGCVEGTQIKGAMWQTKSLLWQQIVYIIFIPRGLNVLWLHADVLVKFPSIILINCSFVLHKNKSVK